MRCARYDDFPELKRLWVQAFTEEDGFAERFLKMRTSNLSNILVLENEDTGELISVLYMLPCDIKSQSGMFNGVNIVGIATEITQRHKGYMTKLINYSFDVMRERKIDLAVLKPSNVKFYEQYGFKVCNTLYKTVRFKDEMSNYNMEHNITDGIVDKLNDIYEKYECGGIKVMRSREDWKFHLAEHIPVISGNSYELYEYEKGIYTCVESVPPKKGTDSGCTMYKIINESIEDIYTNTENMVFEQY